MPSLPTSLLVVLLAAAWLVVLVPMVAKRREHVPENEEASARLRVLKRDSAGRRRHRPVLNRTAMARMSEFDEADADDPADFEISEDVERGVGDTGRDAGGDVREDAEVAAPTRASRYDAVRAGRGSDSDGRGGDGRGGRDGRVEGDRVSGEPADGWDDDRGVRRVPVRPGRGGYDPVASDRARAYRFRQRRRVALALLLIVVGGFAAGLWGVGVGYAVAVTGGVVLALYLAYLRRQVRIEEAIRRRRADRLDRARQIRLSYRPSVAEQVYAHRTGEEPRPGEVGDYQVRSHARQGVPPVEYGYGEPVDLEDSDPAFDDLEYYRPASYSRRAG